MLRAKSIGLFALVALAIAVSTAAWGQQTKRIKRVTASPIASVKGVDLYNQYCAVCHGADGKGNGPAAEATQSAPGDLTRITQLHGGKFPSLHVQKVITGDDLVAAHGSRDMPIWGDVFRRNDSMTQLHIMHNLVSYIEQLQLK